MRELAIPQVEQATPYTCGPAALAAVLQYLGSDVTEQGLVVPSGCTELGTTPEGLVRASMDHAVVPQINTDLTPSILRTFVQSGSPVIVLLQAWPESGRPRRWQDRWADGHYVVCTCVRKGSAMFMDPSLPGARGMLRLRDLEARWHDEDFLGPPPKRRLYGLGIVFPPAAEVSRWRDLGKSKPIR